MIKYILMMLIFAINASANEGFIFLFDEQGSDKRPKDSLLTSSPFSFVGESRLTQEVARFGAGSLLIKGEGEKAKGMTSILEQTSYLRGKIENLTIAAWIRMPSQNTGTTLFWRIPGSTTRPGYFAFMLSGYNTLRFSFTGPDQETYKSSSPVITSFAPGEWTHIGVTFEQGDVVFYENGFPVGERRHVKQDFIPEVSERSSSIGAFLGAQSGSYADEFVVLTNQALNAEDMQRLFSEGAGGLLKDQNQ